MLEKSLSEQCWTYEQLKQMDGFDVRCVKCKALFSSKSDAIKSHVDEAGHGDSFHKHDSEKEEKQRKSVSITQEQQNTLLNKLSALQSQADTINPNLFLALKTSLSALLQMKIADKTTPIAIFFTGMDIDSVLLCLKKIPLTYYVDSFTPKSFVSQSARSSHRKLPIIDLLPKIRNNAMITQNVETMFLGNKPTVSGNMAIIDTVMAGNGYTSHSAVHGQRGYNEHTNFVWLGGINTVGTRYWSSIGGMRHKPYLFQLGNVDRRMDIVDKMLESLNKDTDSSENLITNGLMDYWNTLLSHFSNEKTLTWDHELGDKETKKAIIELGVLLSKFGAFVPTSNTEASDSGGTHYNFGEPIVIDTQQSCMNLYNLARGHAILNCRNYITKEDLELIIHIVLSSLPPDRLSLLDVFFHYGDTIHTNQMEEHLHVSKATALKEMEKLRVLGMVNLDEVEITTKPTYIVRLKLEYHWIFDGEFKNYYDRKFHSQTAKNPKLSFSEQ